MMSHHEVANSSLPVQLLHHITRRRNRIYGAVGVAFVLVAAAVWIYGGFAKGIDFITSIPRPAAIPPTHATPSHFPATPSAPSILPPVQSVPVHLPPAESTSAPDSAIAETHGVQGASASQTQAQTQAQTQTAPETQETDASDAWRHSSQSPAANVSHGIPPYIWQIMLPKKASDDKFIPNSKNLEDTPTWLAMNTDYAYTLVSAKGGDEFVQKHFGDQPRIVEAYHNMPNVGMKSDLLRYLILGAVGGVYTDTDTVALKPIDKWVPAELRDKVSVVVGIEFDRRDGPGWADIIHWVQFCQWTIAAAPGHPVFRKMVARILQALDDLSAAHEVSFDKLKPSSFEVMNSTGPAAWSEVVFQQLQEYDPSLKEHKDLSFMTEPRLIGDILVLTIDGFGMGQPHSNSTKDHVPEAALVKHLFKGSWRGDKRRNGQGV